MKLQRTPAHPRLLLAAVCVAATLTVAAPAAGDSKQQPTTPKPVPVVVRASDGFHWGDAAIGAAAGVGAAIAAMGGMTLARNR
jgi:hypothetical protein